ncbi:MAG: leucine-rich repeat protein [Candidatus Lokiarchaeota archaeon]|nr:leucine-rich repeat protein [Candidatus Lokiarchaeota archaeon]
MNSSIKISDKNLGDHVEYKGKSYPVHKPFHFFQLSVNGVDLKSISDLEGFDQCENIGDLDLSDNQLKEIKGLENLIKLKRLNLSNNNITEIEGIQHLSDLLHLDLSNNKIKKITNLENCKKLEHLDLSGNDIEKIEGLENLKDLKELKLEENKIKAIENINHLSKLTWLDLRGNELTRIENLDELTNLETLNLSENPISKLENLDSLTNLKRLHVKYLPIVRIEGLDRLVSLEVLTISSNIKKYLDIEGLARLGNLEDFETESFNLEIYQDEYEMALKTFRFISMIKEDNYRDIEDWKEIIDLAAWGFDSFFGFNSKYQLEWFYKQCTPKILDVVEEILTDPELEEVRKGDEGRWKDVLEHATKYLFKPPEKPINWEEKRKLASEMDGERIFCVYAKKPDYQMDYIEMADLINDIMKQNIIPDENPYLIETSEDTTLGGLKYWTNLAPSNEFYIRLTPSKEFKRFFKNEMKLKGRLKLQIQLFHMDKDLLDANGTHLGTNFLILSVPFSAEKWNKYPYKNIIQDEKDYYGFYRTEACQIFEKKYEYFLKILEDELGEEIGTGFYLK